MNLEEKTLKRNTIFEGRIVKLYVDEVQLPDGKTSTREIVEHPGAVAVIAITDEGKLVLVEQFRKPLERTLVEIPAGLIEEGEDPQETAKRELGEETGYTCRSIKYVTSFYTSPGFCDEVIHLYFAEGLKKDSRLQLDEDEFVDVLEVTYDEALQLMKEKKIDDSKTVYALQYWKILKMMEK